MPGVSPNFQQYIQALYDQRVVGRGINDWDTFVDVHNEFGVPIEGARDSGFGAALIGGAEAVALAYLGGAALGELTAVEGGALSSEAVEFAEPLGRTPPIVQDIGRWAAAEAAHKLGVDRRLSKLIGRFVVDDDWSYNEDTGDVTFGGDFGGDGGPLIPDFGPLRSLPALIGGGGVGMTPAMGAMPRVAALGSTLWQVLRAGGARFGTWIGANGVRARMTDLWPAVRKYGPQAVAAALGIGIAELGQLLMQAPTTGRRKRGRGISASDIRRAKRVIRFNRRLSRELGTTTGRGRRSYRPRRGRYGYC